jgi:aspartokinase
MVGISIRHAPPDAKVQDALCRVFAKNHLNLTFLSAERTNQKDNIFCCLIAQELDAARQLLDTTISHGDSLYRIIPSVSLLSVFPHQSDIYLVCQLLQTLREVDIPVHALASSIAALTLVIDTDRIESTVETLERFLNVQPETA